MAIQKKRIALNWGGAQRANELGSEVVGIRDGFDGVLFPERYPEGGLLKLTPQTVEDLTAGGSALLGNATRTDPFRVPQINARTCSRRWRVKAPIVLDICTRNVNGVVGAPQGAITTCIPAYSWEPCSSGSQRRRC